MVEGDRGTEASGRLGYRMTELRLQSPRLANCRRCRHPEHRIRTPVHCCPAGRCRTPTSRTGRRPPQVIAHQNVLRCEGIYLTSSKTLLFLRTVQKCLTICTEPHKDLLTLTGNVLDSRVHCSSLSSALLQLTPGMARQALQHPE